MKNMTLANIAAACGGTYHGNEEDQNKEVLSITTDSRKAEPGCLFIAIRGERVDGHDFVDSVFEKRRPLRAVRAGASGGERKLHSHGIHPAGHQGHCGVLPPAALCQGGGDHRKRGKDQHERDDCLCSLREIQGLKDPSETLTMNWGLPLPPAG